MKTLHVIGFQDVERHAINSMVRLSVGRKPSYTIWSAGMPTPDVVLIDAIHRDAYQAWMTEPHQEKIIWVGDSAPKNVHFHVKRPIEWMAVLELMDKVVTHTAQTQPMVDSQAPVDSNLPFNLSDFSVSGTGDSEQTAPILYIHGDNTVGKAPDKRKRVLIVDSNATFRLYLKAILSAGGEMVVDESGDGSEALNLAQNIAYDSVLIDHQLIGLSAINLCQALSSNAMNLRPGDTRISRPNIYLMAQSTGILKNLQAKRAGADGVLIRPRNQAQLDALFQAVNRYAQA